MHGRLQREGDRSIRGSRRSISWHMQPTVVPVDSTSFLKDGRKISIGDCALFKPSEDSPPFIGLIRCLTLDKENILQLGVNWLYRPSELKLGTKTSLDCAPNEIFYSFHKDEKIPAASLLHPCKVAFLPRGVKLPTGTPSFVCRRVYDITDKCLWWLTDQDYINDQQEEVDKLLYKTRTEMHATVHSGGRSPKQVNGSTSTSQAKSGSDNIQNSATSIPSQGKGKKRERGEHAASSVKRERSSRALDGESAQYRAEINLKSDIERITDKGGVTDVEGVEKLVQLMQSDKMEINADLVNRSMLAGVIAATDKLDCLNRFVQLRGLRVLDEWLQDIHKGKVGNGNSGKDGDKSVEEFLLVLLRALDKLPVNLHALQMCNIGRSVNHLRSHKNLEIHRKARGLVDTWKKRVEAEMNNLDAKSGSAQSVSVWPSKSRLPEASPGGSRTPCGSDAAMKSTITQHSTSKATSLKSLHGESNSRSASSSPVPAKASSSPPASAKESQPRNSVDGTSDVPVIREDRGSSTNQSQTYSQSVSGREEGRSSPAFSATISKLRGSTLIQRNGGGFPEITGSQKENSSGRNLSAHRSSDLEKLSQSASIRERDNEGPNLKVNNHKLIVKIPTRVQSPARGVSGGSLEDHATINSGVSSPVLSDKQELLDRNSKEKGDAYPSNSWQSLLDKAKNVLTGDGDGDGAISAAVLPEATVTTENSKTLIVCSKNNQSKLGKSHEISFSPMNALIESCAKYSKSQSSLSLEDDVGMNLLASVATGEMSRSGMGSPSDSTERSSRVIEEVSLGYATRSLSSPGGQVRGGRSQLCNDGENDDKKHSVLDGTSCGEGLHFPADRNCAPSHASPDIPAGEGNKYSGFAITESRSSSDPGEKSNKKTDISGKTIEGEVYREIQEEKAPLSKANVNVTSDGRCGETNVVLHGDVTDKSVLNADGGKLGVEVASSNQICDGDCKGEVNNGVEVGSNTNPKVTDSLAKSELVERDGNEKLQPKAPDHKLSSEIGHGIKIEERDDKVITNDVGKVEEGLVKMLEKSESQSSAVSGSTANNDKNHVEANIEKEETSMQILPPEKGFSSSIAHEARKNDELIGSTCAGIEADEAESTSDAAEPSSAVEIASLPEEKIMFDLNEGFDVNDGKSGEPDDLLPSGQTNVQMISGLPFTVNSVSSGHPASITVTAAAKGPFVPPDDLLRNKGELGWKGSAATSAFRPAEPRKNHDTPSASTSLHSDAATSKHGRTMLDFDLNVPDERVLEEAASRDSALAFDPTTDYGSNRAPLLNERTGSGRVCGSGGLDLDLNRVDETNDNALCTINNNHTGEYSFVHVKPIGGLPTRDVRRDFDLNDGPGFDDTTEHVTFSQQIKAGIPPMLPSAGLRMDSPGLGSFSSWFPPGSTFSTVPVPSAIPDRGHHPFPVIQSGAPPRTFCPAANIPFTPDVYRGSVLSSSPAVSFPSSPFQFPVFPFGATFTPSATFPLPTATFPVAATSYADSSSGPMLFMPPVNSQLLGPIGAFSSQFPRPYMVSLPDSSSNGGLENYRKWDRQGLDLNAGSGATGSEVREEMQPHSSSQIGASSSQMLAEDHARMYSVSGGILKRKDPEGGWDAESFRYKQSSWQ